MTAKQLSDSILQLAIQGKLVPQDPNDEPASVLLDRIREEKKRLVKEGKLKKKDLEETPISEDEIPFEIPESWEWVNLGDVIELTSGRDLEPGKYNSIKKGIPYMTGASNFDNGKLIVNRWTDAPVSISKLGDLLITCKGTIGSMADNVIGDIHIARQIMAIRPYIINKPYLRLFLKSKVTELEKKAKSIIPGFTREDLQYSILPLPPFKEQKRIAQKFYEVLPLIESYGVAYEEATKMNAELPEKLKKSILQEAIMGKLGTQDPNDEPASALLDRIREEKKTLVKAGVLKKKDLVETPISEDEIPFDIPEKWAWIRIGFVAEFINGLAFKPEDWEQKGLPIIRIQNLTDNDKPFNYSSKVYDDKFKVKKGDLLFSWSATLDSFIWGGDDAWLNQHIFKVVPYGCVDKQYLYYLLKGIVVSLSSITHGLTMKHLTRGVFEGYAFPLPPLAEQHRIVEKIEALFAEVDHIEI